MGDSIVKKKFWFFKNKWEGEESWSQREQTYRLK